MTPKEILAIAHRTDAYAAKVRRYAISKRLPVWVVWCEFDNLFKLAKDAITRGDTERASMLARWSTSMALAILEG